MFRPTIYTSIQSSSVWSSQQQYMHLRQSRTSHYYSVNNMAANLFWLDIVIHQHRHIHSGGHSLVFSGNTWEHNNEPLAPAWSGPKPIHHLKKMELQWTFFSMKLSMPRSLDSRNDITPTPPKLVKYGPIGLNLPSTHKGLVYIDSLSFTMEEFI